MCRFQNKIFCLIFCQLLLAKPALSQSFDWMQAERGVLIEGKVAFAGCVPAKSLSDSSALKMAVIQAQANLARAKQISVSGHESALSGSKHGQYSLTVIESSEAFIEPVVVLEEKKVVFESQLHFCVLVAEDSKR